MENFKTPLSRPRKGFPLTVPTVVPSKSSRALILTRRGRSAFLQDLDLVTEDKRLAERAAVRPRNGELDEVLVDVADVWHGAPPERKCSSSRRGRDRSKAIPRDQTVTCPAPSKNLTRLMRMSTNQSPSAARTSAGHSARRADCDCAARRNASGVAPTRPPVACAIAASPASSGVRNRYSAATSGMIRRVARDGLAAVDGHRQRLRRVGDHACLIAARCDLPRGLRGVAAIRGLHDD